MSEAVIANIPRLYTAIAEWMACMVYISQCPKGLTGGDFIFCPVRRCCYKAFGWS